jgi:acyl carrier protein
VERELLAVVRQRLLDPEVEMGPTTPLAAVGLDSMAVMQLLLLIEERFGLWLPESGLTRESLRDVRSLAGVVAHHLADGERAE